MSSPAISQSRAARLRPFGITRVTNVFALWSQRRALSRLDGHLLEDIGLDAKSAHAEASRPVWDVPASWRS